MLFQDRADAGRQLGAALQAYANRPDVLALALPRGGARVLNREVVDALGIPDRVIDAVAAREQQELERREQPVK